MKQKKNLVSSLLVALLAGFIYYQLGGVEDIKRFASFGFQLISNPVELKTNKAAVDGKLIEIDVTKKETKDSFITSEKNQFDIKQGMKEFESDMKEFEKEMKDLDFEYNDDMEEFKEEMKEFKRELKENLKEQKREKRRERENHIDS